MNYFKKIKLAWIFVILLSIINITIFTGWAMHHHALNKNACKNNTDAKESCLMRSRLELNTYQDKKYDSIKVLFREKALPIVDSVKNTRNILMDLLSNDNININKADSLINEVNILNGHIFNQSVEQYIALKKILNPAQKDKLCGIYCDIFGCGQQKKCKNQNSCCKQGGDSCCSKKNKMP